MIWKKKRDWKDPVVETPKQSSDRTMESNIYWWFEFTLGDYYLCSYKLC